MARSSVAVAVVFFLISVALARTPLTLYENEVTVQDTLPDSGVKSILRLPSDTVNDDSHSYPDTDVRPRDTPESEPSSVRSVPLTMIRFHDLRPINRHIPLSLRSRFPYRLCRHHHDHPFFKRMRNHAEIPYGDDMILSTVVVERDLDPIMRSFPEKWVSLPYHHLHQHDDDEEEEEDGISKFVLKHSHRFGKQKLKKHLYHRHRDDEEEEKEEENEENEEKRVKEERNKVEKGNQEEGGFVKRIRKFLDHF